MLEGEQEHNYVQILGTSCQIWMAQLNSNVSMFYKTSSLQDDWKGTSSVENNGILLFHSFPDVEQSPPLISAKKLEKEVIQSFLKHTSITNNLDTESLEFYLTLQINSKFYLI